MIHNFSLSLQTFSLPKRSERSEKEIRKIVMTSSEYSEIKNNVIT